MTAPLDIDRLIERIREEAARPEYQPPQPESLAPLASGAVATGQWRLELDLDSVGVCIASVDDLLLMLDPDPFIDQAYRVFLRRPADPGGLAHHRELLRLCGQPFVLCALRDAPEARALGVRLSGFGLAPLLYRLWHLARRVRLAWLMGLVNRAYHHWRLLRLILTGRFLAGVSRRLQRQVERQDHMDESLRDLTESLRDLVEQRVESLVQGHRDCDARLSDQIGRLDGAVADLELLRARVKVLQQHRYPEQPVLTPTTDSAGRGALAERIDAYYLAFEEANRGSEWAITDGLRHYLQDVVSLPDALLNKPMLDLGCGRGEWLRLLNDQGFLAVGVDLNPDMVARARALGIEVHCTDALTHLVGLPDASQALVSGFHIIEHLPFEQLFQLIEQAWRVLAPGGRLILETPNPENVLVGSHTFYHDFSHRHPITPTALGFLVGYHGFADIQWRRLHPYPESARVATDTALGDRINGHFYGPQDFALIAMKPRS